MLNWAQQFNIFCFLDSCHYTEPAQSYQCLLAAGVASSITAGSSSPFSEVAAFIQASDDFCFGHLAYELFSPHAAAAPVPTDPIGFPLFHFFKPQVTIQLTDNLLHIYADAPGQVYDDIMQMPLSSSAADMAPIHIRSRLTRQQYIKAIQQIQAHILKGDCYELNFCQEFFATKAQVNPLSIFQKLVAVSPNPFSAFYRYNDSYLICASPERYLQKKENTLLSQPIKGTIKRNLTDKQQDEQLKAALYNSKKERAENVMVVDLVRNDLSKICKSGTVKVDELFGIYTFPLVHHMISSISGELDTSASFTDIIAATFPMGSMTGAPKKRVMELIQSYESGSRGIFSGSVGYIDPGKNFDFNVVIRSLMYNAANGYLSYKVGSGITFYSDAEKEWEECLLKGAAIKKVLAG